MNEPPKIPSRRFKLLSYIILVIALLVWMIYVDNNSLLVINDLNNEIEKYEQQKEYYKSEYDKNNTFYERLMKDKSEKEKYARENYFMKKPNEEIFILVIDSTTQAKQK